MTFEERSAAGKRGAVVAFSEHRSEYGKIGGRAAADARTPEQQFALSQMAGKAAAEKLGPAGLSERAHKGWETRRRYAS